MLYKTREESAESLGLFTLLQTFFFLLLLFTCFKGTCFHEHLSIPGFFRINLKETSIGGREGEGEGKVETTTTKGSNRAT